MIKLSGAIILARALKQQGVTFMFGIVGFPVILIAMAFKGPAIVNVQIAAMANRKPQQFNWHG